MLHKTLNLTPTPTTISNDESNIAINNKKKKKLRFNIPSHSSRNSLDKELTNTYLNKVLVLQALGSAILLASLILELVAICTNDWFALTPPPSFAYSNHVTLNGKGGLWNYCSSSSSFSSGVISLKKD